jgi:hypothetical protein
VIATLANVIVTKKVVVEAAQVYTKLEQAQKWVKARVVFTFSKCKSQLFTLTLWAFLYA